MMKSYFVKFWTKTGQITGMTISAYNALDARMYAESLPDFGTLCEYPVEVGA